MRGIAARLLIHVHIEGTGGRKVLGRLRSEFSLDANVISNQQPVGVKIGDSDRLLEGEEECKDNAETLSALRFAERRSEKNTARNHPARSTGWDGGGCGTGGAMSG
jgi:hypothetical protein